MVTWLEGDIFIHDSFSNVPHTTKRQIVIGQMTGYVNVEHHYFKPLYWNKEWGIHNYHGKDHSHRMHRASPMYEHMVKLTKEEAEAARMVLL